MDQKIIDLYDDFTHRSLDRRKFMEQLVLIVGSVAAAEQTVRLLMPDYAHAAVVAENDPRLQASSFGDAASGVSGYLVAPKGVKFEEVKNLVIVIHENRGLNPHIQDVARRVAAEGFVAFAPDFLAPLGGTPADSDEAAKLFAKLDFEAAAASLAKFTANMKTALAGRKIGAIGFCWGGAMVNALATKAPGLDAGVAYYGVAPKAEEVARIKAALMLHYGALDARVNATKEPYEAELKKAGVNYSAFVYEGANHAFNNDTSAERYNADAAKLAWSRSMELLRAKLL